MEKIWTVIDIINWGKNYFDDKEIEDARLNIELLLCKVLKMSRVHIYTHFDQPLNAVELADMKSMIIRRAKREPLQYIIGSTQFYGLDMNVDESVLIPRPETELLADLIIQDCKQYSEKISILEIGTGSGCIPIALAKNINNVEILSTDVSTTALKTAYENAKLNGVEDIIRFQQADILQTLPAEKFDIIVSNPPYISTNDYQELQPEVLKFEPPSALTDNGSGLLFYERFAQVFGEMMKDDSNFYLEIGFDQKDSVSNLFEGKGYEVEVKKDYAGLDRIVKGRKYC